MRTPSPNTSPKHRRIGEQVSARRAALAAAGICIYCRTEPATDGKGCAECRAYNLGRTRARRLAGGAS